MFDPSQTPLISETLLKKRRSLEELAAIRASTVKKQLKRKRAVRGEDFKIKRPEEFVLDRRIRDNSLKKITRRKKQVQEKRKSIIKPINDRKQAEGKLTVGFVIRVHEAKHSSKELKKELSALGLRKKYDAVFFKLDEEGITKLQPYDSYLAYGFISLKHVEELVHRRAYIRGEAGKTPLSDNITVEKLLGDKDIICLNDLSHEIYNLGPNFDSSNKVLLPFNLSAPIGGFEKKTLKIYADKRGFLGENMEEFLSKIL